MCSCDFDGPSAYRETTRRARREHCCCECRAPIFAGDLYVYCSGVWDGRGDSFRRCPPCAALAKALGHYACPAFDSLLWDVEEFLRGNCGDGDLTPEDEGAIGAMLWLARERKQTHAKKDQARSAP